MNSKWHLWISLIKSILRVIGCIVGIKFNNFIALAGFFMVAEILGIAEEIKDER